MDTEEHALLATIIANPEDDTARLVYADWLDEHAESMPEKRQNIMRAQAELIRVQIERSKLIFGSRGFEERDREFGDIVDELEYDYERTWVKELPVAARRRGVTFELDRGFIGEVNCSVKFFVEAGAILLDAAPVTAVRFNGLTARDVPKLVTCSHLARIRTLKLYPDETPHERILALLGSAPISQLTAIDFGNWAIDYTEPGQEARTDPLVIGIAAMKQLSGLKRLLLDAAAIGVRGGEALATSPHLANLEILDLRDNPSLGDAAKMLRKRFGKRAWLTYEDRKGCAVRYLHRAELPGG